MKRKYKYLLKLSFYFLVLVAIYISSLCYSNRSVSDDPPQIVLKKNTDMFFRWDKDSVTKITLKAGDSISVLAHASSTSVDGKLYWAQTRDGQRGLVSQEAVDSGITANKMPDYNRKHNLGTIKMSQKHFEEMCTTKTPAELDELWNHAEFVCHTDSGLTARYQVAVMKKDNGKIYRPVVTFRNDSLTNISWEQPLVSINGWLLRILPGSSIIVDRWHHAIDSFYYPIQFLDQYPWYIYFPGWAALIAIWLIWLLLTFLAIPFLVLILIVTRIPFSFMSNRVLKWFSYGVLYVCAYIWMVLLLVSDHWWFIVIPCLGVVVWIFQLYIEGYIDSRCPHCGEINDYHVKDDVITDVTTSKHRSSKFVQTLERTITTHTRGKKIESRDIEDKNLYQDFIDTYRVYHHKETIKCNRCGGEWEHYYKSSDLIDREDAGMHTENSKEYNVEDWKLRNRN